MTTYNADRMTVAANALVWIEIAFGTLSFWDNAVAKGQPLDYLAAALLTAAFGAVSLLCSGLVGRFAEAEGHRVTRGLAALSGLVLVIVAGAMTFHGLVWLDQRVGLAPQPLLLAAAFGLSGLNVVSLYVFAREIPAKPKRILSPGQLLANERWKRAA